MNIICGFCSGVGHLPNECPIKLKLDVQFKNMGLKSDWGSLKGAIVQELITENIKEKKKRLAKRAKKAQSNSSDLSRSDMEI